MNRVTQWRQYLAGDVLRAAYAQGRDLAAIRRSTQRFLQGTLSFQQLARLVMTTPIRSNWPHGPLVPIPSGEAHGFVAGAGVEWEHRVRQVWIWAEWATRYGLAPTNDHPAISRLDREAHWSLLVQRDWRRTAPSVRPIQDWFANPAAVQATRAEQFILAFPQYCQSWYPYQETTGVMRRAPLWYLLLSGESSQVVHATLLDGKRYQTPLSCAPAVMIAKAMGTLGLGPYAQAMAGWELVVTTQRADTILGHALERFDTQFPTHPERYWDHFCAEYRWFPYDHPLPNLLILLAAWRQYDDIVQAIDFARRCGFDRVGNALIIAAVLAGRQSTDTPLPLTDIPAAVQSGIQATLNCTASPFESLFTSLPVPRDHPRKL